MDVQLFWKSLAVQAAVLAVPFVILALTVDESFFEDWGWMTGPLVWLLASVVTARVLSIPLGHVLFSAVAGGVAGAIVMLATSHLPGVIVALLVFAASCGSYDPEEGPGRADAQATAGSD